MGRASLLLVRCFRLWWDAHQEDGALLHILGSRHDEGKQFAAFVSRLDNNNNNTWKKSLTRTRKDFQSKLGSLSSKYSQRRQKPWGGTCRGETRPWAWRRASRQEFPSNESRGRSEGPIWSEHLDRHAGPHTLWYLHEVAVEERSLGQDEVGRDAAGDRLLDGHQLLLGLLDARIQTLEVAPAQEMRDRLMSCNLNTYRL